MRCPPSLARLALSGFIAGLLAAAPSALKAQSPIGQYLDEAPWRTWNAFPFTGAAALGRGGTVLAVEGGPEASLANPALLMLLDHASLTLGGSYEEAAASRYGPVNTGVFRTDGPLSLGLFALDQASFGFRTGRWAFAATAALAESYSRPKAQARNESRGTLLYRLRFEQEGVLRQFNLSAAFGLSSRLSVGLGLNHERGLLRSTMTEEAPVSGYTILGEKRLDLQGWYVNGGLTWEPTSHLRAALALRAPYERTSRTRSLDRYQAAGGADISIEGDTNDIFRRPCVAGAGLSWNPVPRALVTLDVSWIGWSGYQATWIGEEVRRPFRDLLRLGVGLEYRNRFRLIGVPVDNPIRAGFVTDPQPPTDGESAYAGFTFGTGLRWKGLRLDLGALFASGSGSGDSLSSRRISLTLGYDFR